MTSLLLASALALIQVLAALPWLVVVFFSPAERAAFLRAPASGWAWRRLAIPVVIILAATVVPGLLRRDVESLETLGRAYGAILQVQLTVDLFLLAFALLLWLWPKGGAVALAAFREGVRQWLFWLLAAGAAFMMFLYVFLPYYTFGEDYLMVKQLGYDTTMLAAVVFGALTAALSIGEEIEGRTAITVISKPVSRRQFMLGKYAGIILAALFMFGVLGVWFEGMLLLKHWWDKLEPFHQTLESQAQSSQAWIGVVPMPAWVSRAAEGLTSSDRLKPLLLGIGHWAAHTLDTLPGLVLYFSNVLVLVALAVALATRVPMVVNLLAVALVYLLANLSPVLLADSQRRLTLSPNSPVPRLVGFVARVFDTVLPDLGLFRVDSALISDAAPPPGAFTQYIGSVTFYGVIYTAIVLLFGLILFEDRDLA